MFQKSGQVKYIEDGHFILENKHGDAYKVTQTCAYVWKLLNGDRNRGDIIKAIEKAGDIDYKGAQVVVDHVLEKLSSVHLIEKI